MYVCMCICMYVCYVCTYVCMLCVHVREEKKENYEYTEYISHIADVCMVESMVDEIVNTPQLPRKMRTYVYI